MKASSKVGIVFACLASFAVVSITDAGGRPNVILILTDDQGYGDVSSHGNPVLKTPHLDRLAKESVRFTDFHVAPMCSPTRGQLMTGVDARLTGESDRKPAGRAPRGNVLSRRGRQPGPRSHSFVLKTLEKDLTVDATHLIVPVANKGQADNQRHRRIL